MYDGSGVDKDILRIGREASPTRQRASLSSSRNTSYLSEFPNLVYLQPRALKALTMCFIEKSSFELHSFLAQLFSDKFDVGPRAADVRADIGPQRPVCIPLHSVGVNDAANAGADAAWAARSPLHTWCYCVVRTAVGNSAGRGSTAVAVLRCAALDDAPALLRSLQDCLLPSPTFRAWLGVVTSLASTAHAAAVCRFRTGLYYALATVEPGRDTPRYHSRAHAGDAHVAMRRGRDGAAPLFFTQATPMHVRWRMRAVATARGVCGGGLRSSGIVHLSDADPGPGADNEPRDIAVEMVCCCPNCPTTMNPCRGAHGP